jgi:hypothetical protein
MDEQPISPAPGSIQPAPLEIVESEREELQDLDQSSEEDPCAICRLGMDDANLDQAVAALPGCGHRFHVECMAMWRGTGGNVCPLCRHEL